MPALSAGHPVKIQTALQTPSKIILGIDPGTLLMGYGVIRIHGSSLTMIEMQALKLSPKHDNHERLRLIHEKVTGLIIQYKPDEFAIEAPFFGKNVQSMLKLGRAQGVAIAAAMAAGLPVSEYSPRKVKQSVTGNGNADKEQVWRMLQHHLGLREAPAYFDATDAVAIALCHHFQGRTATPRAGKTFCNRVGLCVIGLEVPHAHLHLVPISSANDINFTQPKLKVSAERMEEIRKMIVAKLQG